MSQALINEVKSLRSRVRAIEEHLSALEANLATHYQRKRGPKPAAAATVPVELPASVAAAEDVYPG